jgi:hypothetical protein
MRSLALTLTVALFFAVGCGTPGAPQPPSLNIPKPVRDLKAVRKGESVRLSWTAPSQTTDGALFRHGGKMLVHRSIAGQSSSNVGELPLLPAHKRQRSAAEEWKDSIADLLQSNSADFAIYTIEAVNNSGKSAGQSNSASVPLVLTPPAPTDLQARTVPQGVNLSWTQKWPPQGHTNLSVQFAYRVMRRLMEPNQQPEVVKQLNAGNEAAAVIDTGIEWEKQYQYWVTPVTIWEKDDRQKGEVEGDDSNVVTITTKDVFPPAVPAGLEAVFSQVGQKSFIDLTWNPDTDRDLAGYNVYRRTEGTQALKINSGLLKTPAFRDDEVQPGMKYIYSVSAVDLRNNESARSEEASESVPK